MSFILDALRKSDNERSRQAAPTLAATPQAAVTKKRSIWLPILVIVLAVNAITFAVIFLTRGEPTPTTVNSVPTTEPAVRSLRKETQLEAVPSEETTALIDTTTQQDAPATIPVSTTEPAPAPFQTIQEDLPSFGQMITAGLVSTTTLHLDMHVYSDDAKKRFVFINMVKYREGEHLAEGPTLEEITPTGVILSAQGNRFRLDRN